MATGPRQRLSNRGGGYVERYEAVAEPPGRHLLRLRCPEGVVRQIRLLDPSYVRSGSGLVPAGAELRGRGLEPRSATVRLVDLLGRVLTLPCAKDVDFAIALDWTKAPEHGVDPTLWSSTPTYDLIKRGKYWYKDERWVASLKEVGSALAELLGSAIDQHPLLGAVDAIAAVPGHDAKQLSFGQRLAHAVAQRQNIELIRCTCVTPFRTPAKNLTQEQRAAVINGQFRCSRDLTDRRVLIVDDIYSSGTSVSETARALRVAGAVRVASLCGARTLTSG